MWGKLQESVSEISSYFVTQDFSSIARAEILTKPQFVLLSLNSAVSESAPSTSHWGTSSSPVCCSTCFAPSSPLPSLLSVPSLQAVDTGSATLVPLNLSHGTVPASQGTKPQLMGATYVHWRDYLLRPLQTLPGIQTWHPLFLSCLSLCSTWKRARVCVHLIVIIYH